MRTTTLLTIILFTGIHALVLCTAYAQTSALVLSDLQVREIMDPSVNQVNTFMIGFNANDPVSLNSVEVRLDDATSGKREFFSVSVRDGKAYLKVRQDEIPFVNNRVEFLLPTRDQLTQPYAHVRVQGFTATGQPTNELVYNSIRSTR